MGKIYIKIHSYEKESDSLIVSFASDETASKNPEDYTPVAVQPSVSFPDATTKDEIYEALASMGKTITKQQKLTEDRLSGKTNVFLFENLVDSKNISIDVEE